MNRQQAPQPVVRPLIILRSKHSIADAIMAQPDVDNMKELTASWVTKNIGEVVINLMLVDNALSAEIVTCSIEGNNEILVSSANVTNEIVIRDLPCYSESVTDSIVTSEVNELIDGISNIMSWGNDGMSTGQREDYDNYTLKYRVEL